MTRAFPATLVLLAHVVSADPASAEAGARVVLVAIPDAEPGPDAVREILQDHLNRLEVRVDVAERAQLPADAAAWVDLSDELASREPGTLAVFGWSCGREEGCDLHIVEPASRACSVVPVLPRPVDGAQDGSVDLAFAIAATAREAVWGGLLLEMRRLASEGARPTMPPEDSIGAPPQYEPAIDPAAGDARETRLLWLEGGYHGNYAHPQGNPVHGPWLGIAVAPARYLVAALSAGWLGIAKGENDRGVVRTNRIPVELQLRLVIPMGLSVLSFAAAGRLDVVFATTDPTGPRGESSRTDLELNAGGVGLWRFPLPGDKVEAVMGAGVLVALLSRAYDIDGVRAVPASSFRLLWSLGIAWSPL